MNEYFSLTSFFQYKMYEALTKTAGVRACAFAFVCVSGELLVRTSLVFIQQITKKQDEHTEVLLKPVWPV